MRVNPFFWLHVQLGGGWRNAAGVVVVYALLVIVGSNISYRMSPVKDVGSVDATWLGLVAASQGLFLLVIGPSSIKRAIQRDFTNGMILSHRMSPMSSLRIVLGYLIGPMITLFMLYGASLALGSVFAARYGISMGAPLAVTAWWGAQGAVLFVALLLSCSSLLAALGSSGKTNMVGIVVAACLFGGYVLIGLVPGIALVGGVMTGDMLLKMVTGRPAFGNTNVVPIAAAAQLALSAVFFAAACRKVRAPERPMFSIPLGLLLLAITGAALVGGIAMMDQLAGVTRDSSRLGTWKLFSSTIAFALVAQFPLISASAELFFAERAEALGPAAGPVRRRRFLSLMPALLCAMTLVVLALMYRQLLGMSMKDESDFAAALSQARNWLAIAAALVLAFWTDFNLIYVAAARGKSVFRMLLISAVVLKIAPLAIEGMRAYVAVASGSDTASLMDGYIAGISPVGTLLLCMVGGSSPWGGLVFQGLVAGFATHLGRKTRVRLAPEHRRGASTPAGISA